MKSIAIIQPYFLPYLGYLQLINCVDEFIYLNDVHYVKRRFINRNRIMTPNGEHMFTLALQKASQNKLITDLTVASDCKKLFQTIKHNYLKAPYYEDVIDFVGELLCCSAGDSFSDFVFETLQKLCAFLGIQTQLIKSSMLIYDRELKAADKLIDICKQRNADQYVNPTGGMDLYSKSEFSEKSIELSFLKFNPKPYPQMSVEQDFHSHMSVIDTLFCAGPEFTKKHIKDYSLI